VSLLAISSCFFASLRVIGSAVGPVTISGINRTGYSPLNQKFFNATPEGFRPMADRKALPHFQKLDH
jgi:hypothetical protein